MNIDKQREIRKFIYNRFPYDNNWLDGNCYYFAIILKERFPEGKIIYDVSDGHFLVRIEDVYFDYAKEPVILYLIKNLTERQIDIICENENIHVAADFPS